MKMSTRARVKKAPVEDKKISHNKQCDMKVFLLDGTLVREDCQNVEIITLRNPSTDHPARYLYAKHLNRIYEILNFAEEPRSWFIDDMAYANGSLYLTTYFDPLFSALYYLHKNCTVRCVPFDQAIVEGKSMQTTVLNELVSDEQLSMIGNQKGDKSLRAFQYDEKKALQWLTLKCRNLCAELQARNFHIGAKSAYFIKSEKCENDSVKNAEGEILGYAFGMLGEYIPQKIADKLSIHLGLEKVNPLKRKSLNELEHKVLKRVKSQEDLSLLIDTKPAPVPEKKTSAKAKLMAKAASGSKNIASFFTKK